MSCTASRCHRYQLVERLGALHISIPDAVELIENAGINQSGLAELLEVEPITLCRIVDKLQAFGLIKRHPHPSDRRIWILHLMPAAHPKLIPVRKLGDMTRSEALTGVSDADRLHLLETLHVLKLNLTDACNASVAPQKRATHG